MDREEFEQKADSMANPESSILQAMKDTSGCLKYLFEKIYGNTSVFGLRDRVDFLEGRMSGLEQAVERLQANDEAIAKIRGSSIGMYLESDGKDHLSTEQVQIGPVADDVPGSALCSCGGTYRLNYTTQDGYYVKCFGCKRRSANCSEAAQAWTNAGFNWHHFGKIGPANPDANFFREIGERINAAEQRGQKIRDAKESANPATETYGISIPWDGDAEPTPWPCKCSGPGRLFGPNKRRQYRIVCDKCMSVTPWFERAVDAIGHWTANGGD